MRDVCLWYGTEVWRRTEANEIRRRRIGVVVRHRHEAVHLEDKAAASDHALADLTYLHLLGEHHAHTHEHLREVLGENEGEYVGLDEFFAWVGREVLEREIAIEELSVDTHYRHRDTYRKQRTWQVRE